MYKLLVIQDLFISETLFLFLLIYDGEEIQTIYETQSTICNITKLINL